MFQYDIFLYSPIVAFILYFVGVELVSINLDKQQVIVNSDLPTSNVQNMIESSGRKAALQGMGSVKAPSMLRRF